MSEKILVIDDTFTIHKMIELVCSEVEVEIFSAFDGQEGLSKFEELKPDVVVCDVHMPGKMNGYEVIEKINSVSPRTPVIMLIGIFEPFDKEKTEKLNVYKVIKKPFSSDEMLEVLREAIEVSKKKDLYEREEEVYSTMQVESVTSLRPPPPAVETELSVSTAEQSVAEEALFKESEEASDIKLDSKENYLVEADSVEKEEDVFSLGEKDYEKEKEEAASVEGQVKGVIKLSDEDIERIARRVVELMSRDVIEDIAWEVIPDMAEIVIKERIAELEKQID